MKKTNLKRPKITEIVPIIVHQLGTPISAIKGYLEALRSGDCGKITRAQEEYLRDALENIKIISGFIDTLLDVERIEEKRFAIKLKPVALEKVITKVLDNLSLWIEANNCEVFFEKPKKLPKVLIDSLRISQVIRNLISNAVIYKKSRGRVKIDLIKEGKNVLFVCEDNGIGIPKADFKKVFTKFYRSEKAMNLYPSGTGLGLFISKTIIELSKGKIWFKKNRGKGMTFYFSLPIAKT